MRRLPLPPSVLEHSASFEWTFWLRHVQRAAEAFTGLDRLLSNQEAREQHLLKIEPATEDPTHEALMTDFVRQHEDICLSEAHDVYRRQMLVVLASLFEGATADFLIALFARKPERMGELTDPKIRVALSRAAALDPANREAELTQLAKTTGRRVSKQSSPKVVERVQKLACGEMQKPERDELVEMLEKRHRIVHERSDELSPTPSIDRWFEVLCAYLNRLHDLAVENGLDVDVGFTRLALAHAAESKGEARA